MDLIAKLPAIAAAIYRCGAQGRQAGPRLPAGPCGMLCLLHSRLQPSGSLPDPHGHASQQHLQGRRTD